MQTADYVYFRAPDAAAALALASSSGPAPWAEIEEWAGDIDPEFLRSVLTELIALARRSQTANDHLYVWTSR